MSKCETVCRINKCNLDKIQMKQLFYYVDVDDEGEKVYVLVNNNRGKKKLTSYKTIEDFSKAVKKL